MKNLEEACIEAYATCPSEVATLDTLEISHSLVAEPIRIVDNLVDLDLTLETAATETFRACAFELALPKNDEGGITHLELTIDDVGQEVSDFVNLVKSSAESIVVKYRPYLSNDLATPQMNPPLRLWLSDISQTKIQVTAKASFLDLVNKAHIRELYTRAKFPSLAG